MKLFALREADGKIVKDAGFFPSKEAAKKARDELNGGTSKELAEEKKHPKFFVTTGPDHFRYEA